MHHLFQLTPRQQEVACLRGEGHSVARIARMLQVHRETIKTHLVNIAEKHKSYALLLEHETIQMRAYEPPEVKTWMPWK